jgi:hypothetical protein
MGVTGWCVDHSKRCGTEKSLSQWYGKPPKSRHRNNKKEIQQPVSLTDLP